MASSKEEFAEIVTKLRELKAGQVECPCPNTRCDLHGDCAHCVLAYRHFGHHVPRCLQSVLDRKAAKILETLRQELGPTPIAPDEYYDYADSVLPKT